MDVQIFTVGVVQENCYLVRAAGSSKALIIDPGDEAPRLLAAIHALGVQLEAILLTHTHFDHVGAVAQLARASGAAVWVPEVERHVLADVVGSLSLASEPLAGALAAAVGQVEGYQAEHSLAGGERLSLAGLEIDVLFTPGHSPGHLAFSIPAEGALFSGDVLFEGSVGRTDLPGGDWAVLLESIRTLVEGLPAATTVYPGHMGVTTLAAERSTNPFLVELAR